MECDPVLTKSILIFNFSTFRVYVSDRISGSTVTCVNQIAVKGIIDVFSIEDISHCGAKSEFTNACENLEKNEVGFSSFYENNL